MTRFLLFPVFFPMLAGLFAYFLGRWQEKARDMFILSASAMELLLVLVIWTNPELAHTTAEVAGFCAMGIRFQTGGFHTLMALLTAAGWMAGSVFCREYMVHVKKRSRFYFFWMLTLGATMGVFLSADLFTAFLFFEVMSFTSFVLVIQTEEAQALRAGETYLAVAVIGGLAALSGLFLLYWQLGTLDLDRMGAAAGAADRSLLWAGALLILVGFGAKAGAFPLHIWLPTAHPAAPAPASAVLSGIIIKTGIYGILVLSTTIFLHDLSWGLLLAAIGAVTMVLGAVLAVCSVDLKRTLACSSISQMGFILVGTAMQCLLGEHNALAVDGTILHILNHSLIKMVLFPLAGIIHLSTHSFDLNEIRGFGRGKPMLALFMGLPMLSLAGVPTLNGYVSKTLLHESIVEYLPMAGSLEPWFSALEWLFLFSGGLTLAYILKLFVCLFVAGPEVAAEAGALHGPRLPGGAVRLSAGDDPPGVGPRRHHGRHRRHDPGLSPRPPAGPPGGLLCSRESGGGGNLSVHRGGCLSPGSAAAAGEKGAVSRPHSGLAEPGEQPVPSRPGPAVQDGGGAGHPGGPHSAPAAV